MERKHKHLVETGLAYASIPHKFGMKPFSLPIFWLITFPLLSHKRNLPLKFFFIDRLITNFSVFVCVCWPILRPYNKHKLDYRARPCVFIGYNPSLVGYRSFHSPPHWLCLHCSSCHLWWNCFSSPPHFLSLLKCSLSPSQSLFCHPLFKSHRVPPLPPNLVHFGPSILHLHSFWMNPLLLNNRLSLPNLQPCLQLIMSRPTLQLCRRPLHLLSSILALLHQPVWNLCALGHKTKFQTPSVLWWNG